MNAIKDSIKSGRTVVGTAGAPNVDVSILADAGYDFLLFDTQHSPGRSSSCSRRPGDARQPRRRSRASPPTRRIRSASRLTQRRVGIIAPMVNTRAEAEAMVRACRYFPLGNRSNAGVRGEWGEFKNYRDYMDAVNNELVIVPMIETNQSLENLDAIASVPGVDVLLIGPSDLSIELGVPLDYQCDIYQRALDKIAATAAKHGVAAGMYFIPPGMDPNFFVRKGFVLHYAVRSLGDGRDPEGSGRDRALTTVDGRRGRSSEWLNRPACAADQSFRHAEFPRRIQMAAHDVCCRLDVAAVGTFYWGAEPLTDSSAVSRFREGRRCSPVTSEGRQTTQGLRPRRSALLRHLFQSCLFASG